MKHPHVADLTRLIRSKLSRPARTSLTLALGITLGAGGLALGDIAVSATGTPSGTVLVCTSNANAGAMRVAGRSGCHRGESRLVLSSAKQLIVTLPSFSGGGYTAQSPGLAVFAPAVGFYRVHVSPQVVRDVRGCALIATPVVVAVGGQISHSADIAVAPSGAHNLLVRVFDNSGNLDTDGVSVEIDCP
jgi:hypothetical protein